MKKVLAVILLFCLAACGGGGGGGSKVATPPLSLSDVTPAKGATGVQRTAVVVLTFSAPLDATTLGASTVTLAGPTGNQQIASSVAGNKLTVTPGSALSPSTPYTLTIGVGLHGSAGEQLAGLVTTSFTTADRQWQTAAAIETGDVNDIEDPQIAINAKGDAVAVWLRSDNQIRRIWSNRYTAGSGWGTALAITPDSNPVPGSPIRDPQVAIDANGNAIAVWPQGDGNNDKIWAVAYIAAMGWGTPVSVEPNASTGASGLSFMPQIKFDANGNAIAVWARGDSTNAHIWSNRYVAGTGWNTATPVDTNVDVADAEEPQIAFDTNGNAIAVWTQSDMTGFHIWSNRYTAAASTWGTARKIDNGDTFSTSDPQIGVDAAGNALVVWYQAVPVLPAGPARSEVWSSRYTAGGDWSPADRISDTTDGAGFPRLAMDANGDALAVWRQSQSTTSSSIRWNRYTRGGGWGTAAVIEPDDGTFAGNPQIACDSAGNALVLWRHLGTGSTSEIRSSRYTVSGGWAASINAGSTADALDPVVAMDSAGNALALWQQLDSANISLVWANRFE